MTHCYNKKDGYGESIQKGLGRVRSFGTTMSTVKGTKESQIQPLKKEIQNTDAIVIGAGAGLTYNGTRFEKLFL